MSKRMLVEQARGVLIHRFHIDADEALALLRRWAQETDSTVRVVADVLVHAVCLGGDVAPRDRAVLDHVAAALQAQPRERPHVPGPRRHAVEAQRADRLDVQVRDTPSLPLVRVRGELDGTSVPRVLAALDSLAESCPAALVVLDLGGLTACDVEALSGLEEAAALMAEAGKELVLHGVSEQVERLITGSGVATGLERH